MKLFTESFLDRWESLATKRPKRWQQENPPNWVLTRSPHLRLQPADEYPRQMYLRQSSLYGLATVAFICLGWLLPFALLWYSYRPILQDPKYHKALIGLLAHEGFYWTPVTALLLLAFSYLIHLPRFYFWNRRAERLRREPPPLAGPAGSVAVDAGIWPPPPKVPTA